MKMIAKNKRATFDFNITDRLIAGIVLAGHEVKSARGGNVSLVGSFATIHDNELWLTNCHIGPYKYANLKNYDPTARRKLLVKKSDLARLQAAKQNGQHIVPTIMGVHGKYIKVELGIGRSAKRQDKRQNIKRKDMQRDAERSLSSK